MKNEPTQLEIFQKERINALENELRNRDNQLLELKNEMNSLALKITVSNLDFLKPISDLEFEIVEPLND